jgi:GNAT superfamily N-acetyltransferase
MALIVSAVSAEDIPSLINITTAAFDATFNRILYHTSPLSESSVEFMRKRRVDGLSASSNVRNFKVADSATGEIVGGAKWTVFEQDEEDQDVEEQVNEALKGSVPESRVDAVRAFFTMLFLTKRELFGYRDGDVMKLRRRVDLDLLYTDPKHQRRGAGKLLTQSCIDEANRLGLDVYVEASEAGKPLYEKLGFKAIKEVNFSLKDYGAPDVFKFIVSLSSADAKRECQCSLRLNSSCSRVQYIQELEHSYISDLPRPKVKPIIDSLNLC